MIMNDAEFQELLADYLAGELDEHRAAAFRAELESNEERRKLAHELQAAAAALEVNALSDEESQRRVEALRFEDLHARAAHAAQSSRPIRAGHPRLSAVLRYAAVIALAFGAGFVVRGWRSEARESPASPVVSSSSINERYVTGYQRVSQAFPRSSSFTRSLLVLARR
jgi:anti-sigma factor RsiW